MIGDALSYPKSGESWLRTVLIGGLLLLFSWLIVPAILLQGYLLRVLRAGSEEAVEPPVFDEWADMLVDGLKVIAVAIGFFLVPFVLAVLLGLAFGGFEAGAIGFLVGVVVFAAYLVAAYLLPAGLTNMAMEGSLGAAFDTDVLRRVGGSSDYLVAVASAIVIGVILGAVASMLTVVLVGVFLLFYVQVAMYYLIGRGYGQAMEMTPETTGDVTPGRAEPTE